MSRIILSVDYRHKGISAYMRIGGRTQKGAERNTKIVSRVLQEKLPKGVHVGLSRYKGYDRETKCQVYEIPVILTGHSRACRAVFSEMLLKGSV
jgi:hypothetical protein